MSKHDDRQRFDKRDSISEADAAVPNASQTPRDEENLITEMHEREDARRWCWEEAFDKFGYDDGDGRVYTSQVVDVLRDAGYSVETLELALHNIIIVSIRCGQTNLMPIEGSSVRIGYDAPRDYLPNKVVSILDEKLPTGQGWYDF